MRTALITGATSGIGKATAYVLAEKGFRLILTGRRTDRLVELKCNLSEKYGNYFSYLTFDVRNRDEVQSAVKSIPDDFCDIDILINNAGLALDLSHIQDGSINDWDCMIDTNIKGLLYVTRAIAPIMTARGGGHIINVGSIAGKEVYENGGVYCATKHAVDALSKAMRLDMVKEGIKVTNVCPGAVETEFSLVRFNGDQMRADKVYNGFEPLVAEDIANIIAYVLTLPKHVCINDILVTPTAQASASYIYRN
jgi:NADP-dependent 3-hydroxy acid dehydrogenase YdfG